MATLLRETALEVAWRQWRALGASTALKRRSTRDVQSLVDPEALVLFSLLFSGHEPRLADLVRDWVVLNSDLLSVQRIKNLERDYGKAGQPELTKRLESLASIAVQDGKDFRWRSLKKRSDTHSDSEGHDAHPHALAELYSRSARGATKSKTRAVRAPLTDPSALLLRLRLGLGVGVKADVLGFLLGTRDDWISVRETSEATAYTVVALRRALDDLAAARLILAREGQPTRYRAEKKYWNALLGISAAPVWLYWHEVFLFVSDFTSWADSVENRPVSVYAFGVYGRELIEQHERAFNNIMIALLMRHPDVSDWGEYVRDAVHRLAASMEKWA